MSLNNAITKHCLVGIFKSILLVMVRLQYLVVEDSLGTLFGRLDNDDMTYILLCSLPCHINMRLDLDLCHIRK